MSAVNVQAKIDTDAQGSEVFAFSLSNVEDDYTETQSGIDNTRAFFVSKFNQPGFTGVIRMVSNATGETTHAGRGEEIFRGQLTQEFTSIGTDAVDKDVDGDQTIRSVYIGTRHGINKSLWSIAMQAKDQIRLQLDGGVSRSYTVTYDRITDKDTTKTPWVLVLNYLHKAGTSPAMNVRTTDTTSGFPIINNEFVDVNIRGTIPDESSSTGYEGSWGHTGNDLFDRLCNALGTTGFEVRFLAKTNNHNRLIHFKSNHAGTITLYRTGRGSCDGIKSSHTKYNNSFPGINGLVHSARLPDGATEYFGNTGNDGMTNHNIGFKRGGSGYHWVMQSSRWDMDDYLGNNSRSTFNQIWVRCDR